MAEAEFQEFVQLLMRLHARSQEVDKISRHLLLNDLNELIRYARNNPDSVSKVQAQ